MAATITTIIITTTITIIIIRLGHVDQGLRFSGVEGEDVGALLENAIARYPDMKIKVTWTCISPDVKKKASANQTGSIMHNCSR